MRCRVVSRSWELINRSRRLHLHTDDRDDKARDIARIDNRAIGLYNHLLACPCRHTREKKVGRFDIPS